MSSFALVRVVCLRFRFGAALSQWSSSFFCLAILRSKCSSAGRVAAAADAVAAVSTALLGCGIRSATIVFLLCAVRSLAHAQIHQILLVVLFELYLLLKLLYLLFVLSQQSTSAVLKLFHQKADFVLLCGSTLLCFNILSVL